MIQSATCYQGLYVMPLKQKELACTSVNSSHDIACVMGIDEGGRSSAPPVSLFETLQESRTAVLLYGPYMWHKNLWKNLISHYFLVLRSKTLRAIVTIAWQRRSTSLALYPSRKIPCWDTTSHCCHPRTCRDYHGHTHLTQNSMSRLEMPSPPLHNHTLFLIHHP